MKQTYSWIVLNGPSSEQWQGVDLPGPVWGCNFAYQDFALDHLCIVDQQTIDAVLKNEPKIDIRVRARSRTYPEHWTGCRIPGLDAGSFALEQSILTYPDHTHIVLGGDGVLGIDHMTRYRYAWRHSQLVQAKTHRLHRTSYIQVCRTYSEAEVIFVSHKKEDDYFRLEDENTIRKTYLALDDEHPKHS